MGFAVILVLTDITIAGRRRYAEPRTGYHSVLRHILASVVHQPEVALRDDIGNSIRLRFPGGPLLRGGQLVEALKNFEVLVEKQRHADGEHGEDHHRAGCRLNIAGGANTLG